jgi:hypothetical protein
MKKKEKEVKEVQTQLVNIERASQSKKQLKTVLFTKPVPQFVDLNLKTLGPFEPGDILRTDIDIANLLILKGRAKDFDID